MANKSFDSLSYREVAGSLVSRLGSFSFATPAPVECSDKWLLSSALQKLIRRGAAEDAFAVACRLHQVDPSYLYRRLPVIAFEDVGLGDLGLCLDVLLLCSSRRWWQRDALQTIAYASQSLARAIKCRALCDLLCWGRILLEGTAEDRSLCSATLLADAARSRVGFAGVATRLALVADRMLRAVDVEAEDAIRELVALGCLSQLEGYMALQSRRTAGLSLMLLATSWLGEGAEPPLSGKTPSVQLIAGVPTCALDQYTRLGRSVFSSLASQSGPIRALMGEISGRVERAKLIGMAVFHVDGSLLDKSRQSDVITNLRAEVELAELTSLGLPPSESWRQRLYGTLEAEAVMLEDLRAAALLRACEMDDVQRGLYDA